MEGQSVVVIHDASREINVKIFEWSLHGLLLVPGDMLTLIAVMHQVITPSKSSCFLSFKICLLEQFYTTQQSISYPISI